MPFFRQLNCPHFFPSLLHACLCTLWRLRVLRLAFILLAASTLLHRCIASTIHCTASVLSLLLLHWRFTLSLSSRLWHLCTAHAPGRQGLRLSQHATGGELWLSVSLSGKPGPEATRLFNRAFAWPDPAAMQVCKLQHQWQLYCDMASQSVQGTGPLVTQSSLELAAVELRSGAACSSTRVQRSGSRC